MDNDKYFIQFRNYRPQKIELLDFSEDLAYTLLETALGDSFRVVSHELQIYQVTCPVPIPLEDKRSRAYQIMGEKAFDYSVERLFKMGDNEPSGFTKREAFEVITTMLLPSWERS